MNYASIRSMDISNGVGIGVALFVQGCHFHCKNCFNKETWDFAKGEPFTFHELSKIIELLDSPHIKRLSILGGEPLANENVQTVLSIINIVKDNFPDKEIWLYTGYNVQDIFLFIKTTHNIMKRLAIRNSDVVVDGQYIDELKDMKYKWAGSTNQRVIDVKSLHIDNELNLNIHFQGDSNDK